MLTKPGSVMIRSLIICTLLTALFTGIVPALAQQSICGEKPTIYLDIGHSVKDFGSTSARGKPEYFFNSRLVRSISAALRRQGKFDVKIINATGNNIPLRHRANTISGLSSGILISIHHDSVKERYLKSWIFRGKETSYSDKFRGYSLFVSGRSPSYKESKKLAQQLGAQFKRSGMRRSLHHADNIPGERRPLLNASIGIYRFDNLAILKRARIPAVLVEAGIIINRQEELVLETLRFRNTFTKALLQSVNAYCQLN